MKYDNQLRYAADIVKQYDGRVPLATWLKDFFRANKQMGSRDRKTVSQMVYGYYRLGHNQFDSIEQQIVAYIFLSGSLPEVAEHFKGTAYNTSFRIDPDKIFPYKEELSEGIEVEEFARSFLVQPDLFLRIRPGHQENVIEKLRQHAIPFRLSDENCIALTNATRLDEMLVINKEAVVQDKTSQQTGKLLQYVAERIEHPRVWDCCAGSGGKSIMAYDIFSDMSLTVSDKRESIIHNLNKRFAEAGITSYRSMILDLTRSPEKLPSSEYDLVIVDVPCSGSGTWTRTPEQLYFFTKDRIQYYSSIQKTITAAVVSSIKPGGYLLYITCSVFAEENEHVVKQLSKNHQLSVVTSGLLKGYHDKADTLFAALLTNQPS